MQPYYKPLFTSAQQLSLWYASAFKKSAEPAEMEALFTFFLIFIFFLIARNHSSQDKILTHRP